MGVLKKIFYMIPAIKIPIISRIASLVGKHSFNSAIKDSNKILQNFGGGRIFDFNSTLPIISSELIILTIFLVLTWFGPVAKILNDRSDILNFFLVEIVFASSEILKIRAYVEILIEEAKVKYDSTIALARTKISIEENKKKESTKKELENHLVIILDELNHSRNLSLSIDCSEKEKTKNLEIFKFIVTQSLAVNSSQIGHLATKILLLVSS